MKNDDAERLSGGNLLILLLGPSLLSEDWSSSVNLSVREHRLDLYLRFHLWPHSTTAGQKDKYYTWLITTTTVLAYLCQFIFFLYDIRLNLSRYVSLACCFLSPTASSAWLQGTERLKLYFFTILTLIWDCLTSLLEFKTTVLNVLTPVVPGSSDALSVTCVCKPAIFNTSAPG